MLERLASILVRRTPEQRRLRRQERLINRYGALLERWPLALLPTTMLPASIDELKEAVTSAWMLTDEEDMRANLAVGYVQLASIRDDIRQPITNTLCALSVWDASNKKMSQLLEEFNEFTERYDLSSRG